MSNIIIYSKFVSINQITVWSVLHSVYTAHLISNAHTFSMCSTQYCNRKSQRDIQQNKSEGWQNRTQNSSGDLPQFRFIVQSLLIWSTYCLSLIMFLSKSNHTHIYILCLKSPPQLRIIPSSATCVHSTAFPYEGFNLSVHGAKTLMCPLISI